MDEIEHKFIEVNGLKIHVAEIGSGSGPVVLFLHGFPEIWYSWRFQMLAVAKAGYRAIAVDYRGYGLSDQPPQPEKTTFLEIVNDIAALLDTLSIPKVFLVGKDFGSPVLTFLCLLHEERVAGCVTLDVPFMIARASTYTEKLPEGFYISRWREPGRAEADFGRLDAKTVVKNIYILFSRSEIPIANEKQEIMDMVEPSTPLPPWFTEEDLEAYGALYEKSGFRTALKVPYRSLGDEHIELPAEPRIKVPALFIAGEKDYVLKFPGMEEYISSGMLKAFVPNVEIVYIPEGSHFLQEQLPEEVNKLILNFLDAHRG
ncbi:PREDICTED: bifunctional epoxide hydrolase 2-like isoform X1 [Ipomoea nil]|uniref:bifunctional epoxide hydrolase 2-like isoform X1 n=1 Tax=Ipomoea nil TaxID=35883 RepID=UPI0009014935|nr:PREDICTED: bifunctional epoxide hydrolase 2-like isoform X1 [Ipomoea nil]